MTAAPTDRDAIGELKARYFRLMDTKQWDAWRDLFTDDMVFYMEESALPSTTEPITTSGDDFVEYVSDLLKSAITVHHGHMGEITMIDDRHATGIWAMFDHVDDAASGFALYGAGHYHEQYERGADGAWRIRELRLTRLRVDMVDPTPVPEWRTLVPGWTRG